MILRMKRAQRPKSSRPRPTSRDVLANLFLVSWICVLLQGALRKWAFPGVTVLYLIQDVPLLLAYIYAVVKGLVWSGKVAAGCTLVAILLSIETLVQLIFVDFQMKTAVIGLHQYIFYLPIVFLLPVCLNRKHMGRFMRFNLWVIPFMALLAGLQSRAGKGAWINRTAAGDETAFGITGTDAVRTTGTFNFTLGYSIWCGIAVALVVGEWLLPPARRSYKSRLLLLFFSCSAALATMVSGSRTAIFLAAAAFLGGIVAALLLRNWEMILRFAGIMLLLPVLLGVTYLISPGTVTGTLNRFSGEDTHREMGKRIIDMTVGFLVEPHYSLLGEGIGTGIQAAQVGSFNPYATNLSEWDTIRGVQELGTYGGIALVLVRYFAAILVLLAGVRAQLQRPGFGYALPLAMTAVPTLAIGDIWRTAPMVATQVFYCVALICGGILFRAEPQGNALMNRAG